MDSTNLQRDGSRFYSVLNFEAYNKARVKNDEKKSGQSKPKCEIIHASKILTPPTFLLNLLYNNKRKEGKS